MELEFSDLLFKVILMDEKKYLYFNLYPKVERVKKPKSHEKKSDRLHKSDKHSPYKERKYPSSSWLLLSSSDFIFMIEFALARTSRSTISLCFYLSFLNLE